VISPYIANMRPARITVHAEISAEPNLFETIQEITHSTESAQEFPTVLSAPESEGVLDTALCQGTTLVVPKTNDKGRALALAGVLVET
jgi:hypothetical protein